MSKQEIEVEVKQGKKRNEYLLIELQTIIRKESKADLVLFQCNWINV